MLLLPLLPKDAACCSGGAKCFFMVLLLLPTITLTALLLLAVTHNFWKVHTQVTVIRPVAPGTSRYDIVEAVVGVPLLPPCFVKTRGC